MDDRSENAAPQVFGSRCPPRAARLAVAGAPSSRGRRSPPVMSMARASSTTKFAAPEYHWEGFGRKSTKPPWYNVSEHDGTRRPLEQWEGGTCGHPRVIEKILTKFPPFVHTTDDRSYVPTLPQSKRVLDVSPIEAADGLRPRPPPPPRARLLETA